ncbi:hypothetical protein [Candidatus Nitrosotalea okcheonensis]|uniref:Nickel/cobalt efflux system n=1 Tax=Candidatus Nitrosotalea okcheonensis TaxID=1903276 RepID=A0A2H1FCI3_9ARCH|nr:hypothetical protein [Candidatus Nitrosotalea okcheonensis]MDE1832705.1 hypothetical protein [Nitrososphaerota archaeon]MDE1841960.1 hypothetical protein [Nitrososphaerota archaeon]SMH70470.1 conserved membrane protein of unknown function [Candidatus Nitrosotalea okcheonensis]
MINPLTYIIGSAIVGILHMAAPDHWLTLCMLAKNQKWVSKKIFRVSFVTAVGHVVLSIAMGLGVVAVGLVFSHLISSYLDAGIGIVMLIAGLVIRIRSLIVKNTHHHDHHSHHDHHHENEEKKNINNLT